MPDISHISTGASKGESARTALVILARYPQPGKTKTRLARSLGTEPVAQLYQAFLTDLAQRFATPAYALHWAYTPPEFDFATLGAALAPQQTSYMRYFPQEGADLGERLLHAFRWTFARGFARTILIGSDSPQIQHDTIEEADAALEHADLVLGPAEDGGYSIIGMNAPYDVFSDIPMSTPAVWNMTLQAAQRQHLRVAELKPIFDVDELPDLRRLAALLEQDRSLAPVTAAHLISMRSIL